MNEHQNYLEKAMRSPFNVIEDEVINGICNT